MAMVELNARSAGACGGGGGYLHGWLGISARVASMVGRRCEGGQWEAGRAPTTGDVAGVGQQEQREWIREGVRLACGGDKGGRKEIKKRKNEK
jgi:hypothetical protein